jgi:predicted metalloprotease with PDZ domain
MRKHRVLIAALALVLAAPAAASAQDVQVYRYAHRGMLGIMTEGVPANTPNARQRIVVDVVKDSPAERAGVLKGDTIVRINGLAATGQVMSAPFEPGDTVILRVRRDGRERDVTVVATERSTQFSTTMIADSVFGRMSNIFEAMRISPDSIRGMYVRRMPGDSAFSIVIGSDTLQGRRVFEYSFGGVMPDSIRGLLADSARFRVFGDTAHLRIMRSAEGDLFRMFGDSTNAMRPFDIMTSATFMGFSAVAGAELANLNPDLGEYFGTADGVLVMSARSGTPAERAGLRAGDVIQQVNGTDVRNLGELRRAVDTRRGESTELRVLRRGQTMTVTLTR